MTTSEVGSWIATLSLRATTGQPAWDCGRLVPILSNSFQGRLRFRLRQMLYPMLLLLRDSGQGFRQFIRPPFGSLFGFQNESLLPVQVHAPG